MSRKALRADDEERVVELARGTHGSSARPIRILVVDDEQMVRDLLQKILTADDYDVITAVNGRQAMMLIVRERFDLIITDIAMPEMDGIEVLRAVKEIDSSLPVILISGYPSAEKAVRLTNMGAAEFIAKPFNLDIVKLTVAKVLEEANQPSHESEPSHAAAAIDRITGTYSFELLFASLESELARSEWRGRVCSLLVLEVDDLGGRSSGEELLRTFVSGLKQDMPPDATLGRTDTKEFAVILPETSLDEAMALAETVQQKRVSDLTISYAVTSYPSDGSDASALIERARDAIQASNLDRFRRTVLSSRAIAAVR